MVIKGLDSTVAKDLSISTKNSIRFPSEKKLEQYKSDIALYRKIIENLANDHIEIRRRTKYRLTPKGELIESVFLGALGALLIFFILNSFFNLYIALLVGIISLIFFTINSIENNKKNNKEVEKIKEHIEEAEQEKTNISKRLEHFEKPIYDYYRKQIDDLYQKKLYRKKSGGKKFQESLVEFSAMVEEFSTINSNFVTVSRFESSEKIREYKKYLERRQVNHNLQVQKDSPKLVSIRNFAANLIKLQESAVEEIIAPEKKYATARKIDNWEEINKKRKVTGLKGEEIVISIEKEYLESINRKDLSDKVRHVSLEYGDGLGYDVLSFFENGKEKYIEVKSTGTSLNTPYYLSRNELAFLNEHHEDYFLYRILITKGPPEFKAYSSSEVLKTSEIIPTQYIVQVKK